MKKAAIATATAGIAVTAFAAPTIASASTVVVESGDTLWGIAEQNDTTVDSLKQLNQLTSDKIFPGQKLVVSEQTQEKSEKQVTATWLNVRDGAGVDNNIITSLKGGTKVTVETTESNGWNKITYGDGQTGFVNGKYLGEATQAAAVTETATTTEQTQVQTETATASTEQVATDVSTYKVKSGDTLWGLSTKFGVSVNDLMSWNNLSSSSIYVGQNLAVKASAAQPAASTQTEQATEATATQEQTTETAAQASEEQTTSDAQQSQATEQSTQSSTQAASTATEEKQADAIDTSASTYTVRSGDSLSKIAGIFGTSVSNLKALNGLSSDALQVGQVLKVKGQAPAQNTTNNSSSTASSSTTNNNTSGSSSSSSSTSDASSSSSSSSSYSALLSEAQKHLGKPYSWGGNGPSSFDCSGFTKYVYGKVGVSLPRTASAQYSASTKVSESQAKPGDLVFFNYGSGIAHVGIYVGGGQMIDAQDNGVKYDNIHGSGWGEYLVGFGRVANF